jgi:adenylosuccinate synthase
MNIWKKIKDFFKAAPTLQEQFQEMVKVEEAAFKNISASVETTVEKVEAEVKAVNDQITDAVTQVKAVVKRAKTSKGRFKADDKVTLKVNEAWEGGVAPAKNTRKKKK